jgi:hypothetical protein
MKLISDIKSLLTGLWLGSAILFVGVAQTAFSIIPARDLAGAMVSRTLAIVNIAGIIIGLMVLALSFLDRKSTHRKTLWLERILTFILLLSCAVGQFVIALWMSYLRGLMGRPIDEVLPTDPLRVQFNSFHQYSVWVLMVGMISALLLFFVSARLKRTSDISNISDSL